MFDPTTALTNKATSSKALHIVNFLLEKVRKRQQRFIRQPIVLSADSSNVIVLETPDKDYLGITVDEWGAANLRLMYELIKSRQLHTDHFTDYLSYSAQVFDLVTRYSWRSILEYDFLYRESQAEHQFRWGSYAPHLNHILLPRAPSSQPQQPVKYSTQRRDHTSPPEQTTTPLCHQYLPGHCHFGDKCRFMH